MSSEAKTKIVRAFMERGILLSEDVIEQINYDNYSDFESAMTDVKLGEEQFFLDALTLSKISKLKQKPINIQPNIQISAIEINNQPQIVSQQSTALILEPPLEDSRKRLSKIYYLLCRDSTACQLLWPGLSRQKRSEHRFSRAPI